MPTIRNLKTGMEHRITMETWEGLCSQYPETYKLIPDNRFLLAEGRDLLDIEEEEAVAYILEQREAQPPKEAPPQPRRGRPRRITEHGA